MIGARTCGAHAIQIRVETARYHLIWRRHGKGVLSYGLQFWILEIAAGWVDGNLAIVIDCVVLDEDVTIHLCCACDPLVSGYGTLACGALLCTPDTDWGGAGYQRALLLPLVLHQRSRRNRHTCITLLLKLLLILDFSEAKLSVFFI